MRENWNAAANSSYLDLSYVTHLVRDKSWPAVIFSTRHHQGLHLIDLFCLFWAFLTLFVAEKFLVNIEWSVSIVGGRQSIQNQPSTYYTHMWTNRIKSPFVNMAIERSDAVNSIHPIKHKYVCVVGNGWVKISLLERTKKKKLIFSPHISNPNQKRGGWEWAREKLV
jgi:hypothetical protein